MRFRPIAAIALLMALPISAFAAVVPEPSTMALFAVGLGAALYVAKRRKG